MLAVTVCKRLVKQVRSVLVMPKASFNKFCCGKSACLSILTASLLKHLQTFQDTDDIKIFLKLKFMEKLSHNIK